MARAQMVAYLRLLQSLYPDDLHMRLLCVNSRKQRLCSNEQVASTVINCEGRKVLVEPPRHGDVHDAFALSEPACAAPPKSWDSRFSEYSL